MCTTKENIWITLDILFYRECINSVLMIISWKLITEKEPIKLHLDKTVCKNYSHGRRLNRDQRKCFTNDKNLSA